MLNLHTETVTSISLSPAVGTAGEQLSLTCTANIMGTASEVNPTFQWLTSNDSVIENSSSVENMGGGVFTNTLTVQCLPLTLAGTVTCRVTITTPTMLSDTATTTLVINGLLELL